MGLFRAMTFNRGVGPLYPSPQRRHRRAMSVESQLTVDMEEAHMKFWRMEGILYVARLLGRMTAGRRSTFNTLLTRNGRDFR